MQVAFEVLRLLSTGLECLGSHSAQGCLGEKKKTSRVENGKALLNWSQKTPVHHGLWREENPPKDQVAVWGWRGESPPSTLPLQSLTSSHGTSFLEQPVCVVKAPELETPPNHSLSLVPSHCKP